MNRAPLFREARNPSVPNLLIYHIGTDAQGRKQGLETWWYGNGSKRYEGTDNLGIRNGVFQAWYPDGKLWYRGDEVNGVAEDSLIYWYPNGALQAVVFFRHGVQIHYQSFDSMSAPPVDAPLMKRPSDSLQLRKQGITEWGAHVRATVEPGWILPHSLLKKSYRAVVLLRIGRAGEVRSATWTARSPSSIFNKLAVKALKKIKRYPVFPAGVTDSVLEIQYEFVTPGKASIHRRLILRGSPTASEPPPMGE